MDRVFLLQAVGRRSLREGKHAIDAGMEPAGGEPAIEVVGRGPLFAGGRLEHHKAEHRAALHIERTDRKLRPGVASRHQHNPPALSQVADDPIEVWLAQGFPEDIHPAWRYL